MKRRSELYFPNIMFHYYYYCLEMPKNTFSLDRVFFFFSLKRTHIRECGIRFFCSLNVQNAFFRLFRIEPIKFLCFFDCLRLWRNKKKKMNWIEGKNRKREWKGRRNSVSGCTRSYFAWNTSLPFLPFRLKIVSAANIFHLILNAISKGADNGSMIDAFKWTLHLCLLWNIK